MKLLHKETMKTLWRSGNKIVRRGKTYWVGRTASGRWNEPSYFLEPFNDQEPFGRKENLPRPKGTIFIPNYKLSV